MTPPVSAFLITRNEEARLPRALAALEGLVAEVVVVDSGSTDRTVEIAEAAGAQVLRRDWTGYGPQKRFAEEACAQPWRLNLDADEVVTPELAAEIRALFADGEPAPGGYTLRILNVYPGEERPRPLARDYEVVRLYHRDAGRYRDHPLFDRVEMAEGAPVGRLVAPVLHFPFLSFHALVEKENAFTSYQAEAARPRARWKLLARLPFEFPYWFLRNWLLRGHVLGGWKGFAFSACIAFARLLRIVKMLEKAEERRRG